jgi:P pilus assembly chaperone PapD
MTPLHNGTWWTDEHAAAVPVPGMPGSWALRGVLVLSVVVWASAVVGVRALLGQVSAVIPLHGTDASVTVANPTTHPLHVALTLYRDATLRDSMAARISPSAFTLQPGAQQVVRLRLPVAPTRGAVLRLATTFTPVEEAAARPTMRFVLATRVVVRVEVAP